jgi:hypothetical protein
MTYPDGANYACIKCGQRWPISGTVQIVPITINDVKQIREDIMTKNNRIRSCDNCGREKVIQSHGRCGGCNGAVKGLIPDTPEFLKTLAAAKERFSDPNYKRGGKRSVEGPKKISSAGVKKIKTHVRALKIKHAGEAPADMALVIASMEMQRDSFLSSADKMQKAIDILMS